MAANREATGLAPLRILLGVFFVLEGVKKLTDLYPLTFDLEPRT
jgi:uncharacterized membrane protein YphA (DoxX/SURF4 family)